MLRLCTRQTVVVAVAVCPAATAIAAAATAAGPALIARRRRDGSGSRRLSVGGHPSDHGYQEWGDRPGPRSVPKWARVTAMGALVATLALAIKLQTDQRNAAAASKSAPAKKPTELPKVNAAPATEEDTEYPPNLVQLHRDARSIFDAALAAADPRDMIRRTLSLESCSPADPSSPPMPTLVVRLAPGRSLQYDLSHFQRVVVVGAGKAATRMSAGVEDVLGERVTIGHVVTKHGHIDAPLRKISVTEAAHPVPDAQSVEGARRVSELVTQHANDPHTLLIVLLSGGGSSLLVEPAGTLTLADIQAVNRSLLRSGMAIGEVNQLRKHTDEIKGGGLLRRAGTTPVLALVLSDVIGDNLGDIASGPTVPFQRDFSAALRLLDQYNLRPNHLARNARQLPATEEDHSFPIRVYEHILSGAKNQQLYLLDNSSPASSSSFAPLASSAASGAAAVSSVPTFTNLIVGSNRHSLVAAAQRAESLGYEATILTDRLEGEARDAAAWLSLVSIPVHEPGLQRGDRVPRAFIAGGETTVSFALATQSGLGGRNQEFALAGAMRLHEHEILHTSTPSPRTVVLAAGTDGTDGPTDATGAVVDALTVPRAIRAGLSAERALERHDSYPFFAALDAAAEPGSPPLAHIKTGPTGTNVADVYIALTR